jgi:hypothetical protein
VKDPEDNSNNGRFEPLPINMFLEMSILDKVHVPFGRLTTGKLTSGPMETEH